LFVYSYKIIILYRKMEKYATKICSKCKKEKTHDEFNVNKSKKDGRQSFCKSCNMSHLRKYRGKKSDDEYKKLWEKLQNPADVSEFDEIVKKMREFLSGPSNIFTIDAGLFREDSSNAEVIAVSKLQLFIMQKKQIMIQPEQISITRKKDELKVVLPETIQFEKVAVEEFKNIL